MKTRTRSDVEVTGNLGGEEVPLSLDHKSLPHLMNVMTRIYSNPPLAVLREVATNARDSHIAAGKSKVPIKITLPNKMHPVLTITDQGVGLSVDDLKEIYSKYGASTKRNTDRQTGSLGLGCKSPLAYCAGFNITAIKNGLKTLATITRDESGAGTMRIIKKNIKTSEGNGVVVEVPAPPNNEFRGLADKLFRFWPQNSVLVDGQPIDHIEGLKITKDILICSKKELDSNYIVMGGVPYKHTDTIIPGNDTHSVVAFVEMGAVDFAPSRETLELTPDTVKRIEQIGKDATDGLAKSIQKKIDKAKSHVEAAKIMAEHVSLVDMRSNKFFYNKEEIPYTIDCTVISSNANSWKISDHSRERSVGIQAYSKQLVVTDYTPSNFVASHKKKIEQYVRDKNILIPGVDPKALYPKRVQHYLCFPEVPEGLLKWVDPAYVVDWETIRKIKIPIAYGGREKVAGTYACWNEGGAMGMVEEDDVDSKNLLLYTTSYKRGLPGSHKRLISYFNSKYTVAYMAGNREAKFKRLFPKAVQVNVYIDTLKDRFKKELTESQKTYLKYADYKQLLQKLNPVQIKDIELRKLIRVMQKNDYAKIAKLCSDMYLDFGSANPLKDYPLLYATHGSYHSPVNKTNFPEHATLYINAVCSAKKKNTTKGAKVNV